MTKGLLASRKRKQKLFNKKVKNALNTSKNLDITIISIQIYLGRHAKNIIVTNSLSIVKIAKKLGL